MDDVSFQLEKLLDRKTQFKDGSTISSGLIVCERCDWIILSMVPSYG